MPDQRRRRLRLKTNLSFIPENRQYLHQIGIDTANPDKSWSGSCAGMAITVILAKNGVFTPSRLQSDAKTLSHIQPTDDVRSFIN